DNSTPAGSDWLSVDNDVRTVLPTRVVPDVRRDRRGLELDIGDPAEHLFLGRRIEVVPGTVEHRIAVIVLNDRDEYRTSRPPDLRLFVCRVFVLFLLFRRPMPLIFRMPQQE